MLKTQAMKIAQTCAAAPDQQQSSHTRNVAITCALLGGMLESVISEMQSTHRQGHDFHGHAGTWNHVWAIHETHRARNLGTFDGTRGRRTTMHIPRSQHESPEPKTAQQEVNDCETYPYITPIYYSSFHFLFHYPYITPIYYRSFHFHFHYPYITPMYYSSFHFLCRSLRGNSSKTDLDPRSPRNEVPLPPTSMKPQTISTSRAAVYVGPCWRSSTLLWKRKGLRRGNP